MQGRKYALFSWLAVATSCLWKPDLFSVGLFASMTVDVTFHATRSFLAEVKISSFAMTTFQRPQGIWFGGSILGA